MIVPPAGLSSSEAEQLRAFERQGHDALAKSYHAFFAAVTALAINPLFDEVHLHPGTRLLDVASGLGALTAEAANRGARSVGVDLSPRMIELARRRAWTFSPARTCCRRVRTNLITRRTHCICVVG